MSEELRAWQMANPSLGHSVNEEAVAEFMAESAAQNMPPNQQAAAIAQPAVVRPGDTLILRVTDRTPMEYIDRIRKVIREKLPDVEVLVIGGVDEMAIYRPGKRGEHTVDADVTPEQAARFAKEMERQASAYWTQP